MKFAILSDIHGNATALKKVLKDLESFPVDLVISLGDNIGYGPEPEEVVNLIRERNIPSVIGNHELAINRPRFLSWFNPSAKTSLEKTKRLLSKSTLSYISKLSYCMVLNKCRFVHGFPPGSATIYLFELPDEKIKNAFQKMREWVCFLGHTHLLEIIAHDGVNISKRRLEEEVVELDITKKYLINVGSVGQPRDGNNQAKYVLWDTDSRLLTVRYVAYDISDTVKKIYRAGLPEQHAWRLM
ncbi:MAG: metallophosphatase family protein [Desulfobacterales bacterium]|jgi:predicted phosphodiesterase|nr:metallophosphatase family protein [Desulfobacterales bacterium]